MTDLPDVAATCEHACPCECHTGYLYHSWVCNCVPCGHGHTRIPPWNLEEHARECHEAR